eukprot:TRINITY_DN4491_c2_g1_i1.p1 TRINITY_DN4491_c2_g1~~TRINITY_DN4491_c2_g1_i1.p1  ORF type:complete len:617 (+),score=167.50 TRINITY_DN4491_c2_g1_i1:52-1902(+)
MASTPCEGKIEVFVAKKIYTLNEGWPLATAIAVKDGRIVGLGSLEDLKPWLESKENTAGYTINRTFENKYMYPGFIDPHMHPLIGGMAASLPCLAYYDQPCPYNNAHTGLRSVDDIKEKIKKTLREKAGEDKDRPVLFWGYDQVAMGGHLDSDFFDYLEEETDPCYHRNVAIWDASLHYAYVNKRTLKWACVVCKDAKEKGGEGVRTRFVTRDNGEEDEELTGCFLGNNAMSCIMGKITDIVIDGQFSIDAMKRTVDLACLHGATTVSELGMGLVNLEKEEQLLPYVFNHKKCPLRCVVVTLADAVVAKFNSDTKPLSLARSEAVNYVQTLNKHTSTPTLQYNGCKFFTDDAFVGLTMQMCCCPGYIDGHKGIWLAERGIPYFERVLPWWKAGVQIHVHSNGDEGQNATLELLQDLQNEAPRFDHRFTFEHYGMSTVAHARRVKALGACASVNIYYPYLRGELNEAHLGTDRSHMASRLGTLVRHGIPTAVHTDTPIAPPNPLEEIWVAVNRVSAKDLTKVLAPEERISRLAALKMVTIDAAYVLQKDHLLGSLEAGKYADFTILEDDLFEVPEMKIRDIEIWGTVMGGVPMKRGYKWSLDDGKKTGGNDDKEAKL